MVSAAVSASSTQCLCGQLTASSMGNALNKLRTLKNDIASKQDNGGRNGAAKEDQPQTVGKADLDGGEEGEEGQQRIKDVVEAVGKSEGLVEEKTGEVVEEKTGEVVEEKTGEGMKEKVVEEDKAEAQATQVVFSSFLEFLQLYA